MGHEDIPSGKLMGPVPCYENIKLGWLEAPITPPYSYVVTRGE